MKHTKIVEVPATQKEVVDYESCDLCGAKIQRKAYDVDEVTVAHVSGSCYPDGSCLDETSVDMCGKCFEDKLVPWLTSLGVVVKTKDISY